MTSTEFYGRILAVGVAGVAASLVLWQSAERRRRGPSLSAEDASHFARQDVRRWAVAVVMLLLAAGLHVGSGINPNRPAGPYPCFIETWLAVFALILILLVLAMLDWLATRRYAARHRTEIVREGMQILCEEMRLRAARPLNGKAEGPNGNGSVR